MIKLKWKDGGYVVWVELIKEFVPTNEQEKRDKEATL